VLDRVQNKAAKFADHGNDSNQETLVQRRKINHISALFKSSTGERALKDVGQWFSKCAPRRPWEARLPHRGAAKYYAFS
jgi:hypothetical protein